MVHPIVKCDGKLISVDSCQMKCHGSTARNCTNES
jgi:cytochrome P450